MVWYALSAVGLAALVVYWRVDSAVFRRRMLLGLSLIGFAYIQPVHVAPVVAFCYVVYRVGAQLREDPTQYRKRGVQLVLVAVLLLIVPRIPGALRSVNLTSFDLTFAIPLGMSYFMFRIIHYLMECSRGTFGDHSFADFLSYVIFLPTLPAGPIERFEAFDKAIPAVFEGQFLIEGAQRILFGLFKKIVIADFVLRVTLGAVPLHDIAAAPDAADAGTVWTRLILYYLYCYFDFAALSDIAIGCARCLGVKICENFNWPILARDPGDFWQRWHMSLSNFCRYYIYLYIVGHTRKYYPAFLGTMVVMGLWHDLTANWLLWGVFHATGLYAFLMLKNKLRKKKLLKYYDARAAMVPRWAVTFAWVSLGYALVGTSDPIAAVRVWVMAFGLGDVL